MRLWQTNPLESITLVRGEGCRVWDTRGKSYLDLLSGCWCAVLGHGHPRLAEEIKKQADRLIHAGPPMLSEGVEEGLRKLAEILPPALDRTVFLNTGSEAVELGLKMARAATGADEIVVIERSYYGATTYAYSLSESGRNVEWLPKVGRITRIPAPHCRNCPAGARWPCGDFPCLGSLRDMVNSKQRTVAAVLFEPILANAGMIIPPIGYGARLRDLSNKLGALLIAEEVTTGMGRTGRWFGYEHDCIVDMTDDSGHKTRAAIPDILILGKALGGGLPVAAVATTAEVEARCRGKLTHVQSHQNDPFSGHIAATVISILQEGKLVEQATEKGHYLLEELRNIQSRHAGTVEIRGRGLMLGIELDHKYADAGVEIYQQLLEAGYIVNYQPHNAAFRLFPPYVISQAELEEFLRTFENILMRQIR